MATQSELSENRIPRSPWKPALGSLPVSAQGSDLLALRPLTSLCVFHRVFLPCSQHPMAAPLSRLPSRPPGPFSEQSDHCSLHSELPALSRFLRGKSPTSYSGLKAPNAHLASTPPPPTLLKSAGLTPYPGRGRGLALPQSSSTQLARRCPRSWPAPFPPHSSFLHRRNPSRMFPTVYSCVPSPPIT